MATYWDSISCQSSTDIIISNTIDSIKNHALSYLTGYPSSATPVLEQYPTTSLTGGIYGYKNNCLKAWDDERRKHQHKAPDQLPIWCDHENKVWIDMRTLKQMDHKNYGDEA